MVELELIKTKNLEEIAEKGTAIYEKVKDQYQPQENGKFLAIDTETGKVYFGESGTDAIELARMEHPDTVFYLVKIGHSFVETIARMRQRTV